MRKFVLPFAAALVASATMAYAAAQTETGVIAKIDSKAPSITLKAGKVKTFFLDKSVSLASLKVGEKVTVNYDMTNNKPMASAVTAAP
jgi:Cu/Ag efflux protein CusF